MEKTFKIHRGNSWHLRATKWHVTVKTLKMMDITMFSAIYPISAYKALFTKTFKAVCSELRQVCTFKVRNHRGGSHLLPRQGLEKLGNVGECLLKSSTAGLALGLLLANTSLANGWSDGSDNWNTTSSFVPANAKRSEPPPGSSFASARSGSSFDLAPQKGSGGNIVLPVNATELQKLHQLIALAEAGANGYDAVQYGATILPPAPPSAMTIDQIFKWIEDTPGQQHAIGRYQIIPSTLSGLVRRSGLPGSTVFHSKTQDLFATMLISDAGYERFITGELGRDGFMANLAGIWAGLPLKNGKSAHEGVAGNKATITRATYEAYMAQIFPVEASKPVLATWVAATP